MEGQINLLDYIDANMDIHIPKSNNEPPILLHHGDIVYVVIKGDVEEYYVYDEKSWLCGEGERGYRLKQHCGGYDCCWNKSIGVSVFKKYEDAIEKANEYIENSNCMKSSEIIAEKTVAFKYKRSVDDKELIAFYADIGNGLLYIKDFITYHHICENELSVIKEFMKQDRMKEAIEIEYKPTFKNMYPVKDKNDTWKYCEARGNK